MEHQIEQAEITYLMHESAMARADRKNRRLWITINLLIAAIAAYGAIRCLNNHS